MTDWWKDALTHVPFIMTVNGRPKVNTERVFEGVIIAVMTAFLTAYISVQKLEVRMMEIERKVERIQSDFYQPRVQ